MKRDLLHPSNKFSYFAKSSFNISLDEFHGGACHLGCMDYESPHADHHDIIPPARFFPIGNFYGPMVLNCDMHQNCSRNIADVVASTQPHCTIILVWFILTYIAVSLPH
jgi:hypothetical protein